MFRVNTVFEVIEMGNFPTNQCQTCQQFGNSVLPFLQSPYFELHKVGRENKMYFSETILGGMNLV